MHTSITTSVNADLTLKRFPVSVHSLICLEKGLYSVSGVGMVSPFNSNGPHKVGHRARRSKSHGVVMPGITGT